MKLSEDPKFVFYLKKYNRYSIKALLGSIERYGIKNNNIYIKQNLNEVLEFISKTQNVTLLLSFPTPQVFEIEKEIKEIKKTKKDLIIIVGGPHASGIPSHCFKIGVDKVVIGEGEKVIIEILKNPYHRSKIIVGEKITLDEYPSFSKEFKIFGPIELTRGCPFSCTYCQTPRIFGQKPRHRSIDKIVEEVEIRLKHGRKDIRFISPNALGYGAEFKECKLEKIEELLKTIRKILKNKGRIFFGTFPSEIRPEFITKDTVKILKENVNNNNITIGAQSGSERILELIKREHGVEDVVKAVEILTKNGFLVNVDFMFGLPEETEKDRRDTIRLMELLVKKGARIHAHTFIPLPGTPLFSKTSSEIDRNFIQRVEHFISSGNLFGQWKKQLELRKKILKKLIS